MFESNYFIRGYAIHGYAEVPTYAASHGCLRVPIPDAPAIYAWVRMGTPVDVYNESGGGTRDVAATPARDAGTALADRSTSLPIGDQRDSERHAARKG